MSVVRSDPVIAAWLDPAGDINCRLFYYPASKRCTSVWCCILVPPFIFHSFVPPDPNPNLHLTSRLASTLKPSLWKLLMKAARKSEELAKICSLWRKCPRSGGFARIPVFAMPYLHEETDAHTVWTAGKMQISHSCQFLTCWSAFVPDCTERRAKTNLQHRP